MSAFRITLAVYHQEHPQGGYTASCPSWPAWTYHAENRSPNTRALVEDSLRDHIVAHTNFAHYLVPIANDALRRAAS